MKFFVPGPLHPDLFGGMTPIMVEENLYPFTVKINYDCPKSTSYRVVASDENEAEEFAEFLWEESNLDCEFREAIAKKDTGEIDKCDLTDYLDFRKSRD